MFVDKNFAIAVSAGANATDNAVNALAASLVNSCAAAPASSNAATPS